MYIVIGLEAVGVGFARESASFLLSLMQLIKDLAARQRDRVFENAGILEF